MKKRDAPGERAGGEKRAKRGPTSRRVVNLMKMRLPALSVNEGMARAAVAAFCAQLNPTAVELADVKCAVSEAVTNCIVHAYRVPVAAPDDLIVTGEDISAEDADAPAFTDAPAFGDAEEDSDAPAPARGRKPKKTGPGTIWLTVKLCEGGLACIEIRDRGCGIPDVKQAMQPLYTTDPEGERSGMGFTVMESFCDHVRVSSSAGRGTTVILWKRFGGADGVM